MQCRPLNLLFNLLLKMPKTEYTIICQCIWLKRVNQKANFFLLRDLNTIYFNLFKIGFYQIFKSSHVIKHCVITLEIKVKFQLGLHYMNKNISNNLTEYCDNNIIAVFH